jgi:UDP-N-acetylglucosamine diphosphorylase/glucosamine-1-phosphate N-acetyltransferase
LVYPWDLLTQLEKAIALDFSILTKRRRSQPLPKTVSRIGKHPVFISKGAKLLTCTLNATAGPIYIGPNAEVQEGVAIRGPFLMGEGSVVKMGAMIYGPAAIGQGCLLGGELKRSLIFPFSNKAHHGYMGDSVIGSWCNWGAGTSNSNLKNTAGEIRISVGGVSVAVGQKAGVFMGDHSRTAINTSLNSGSVMGVSVQVGNDGLSPKQISSFRWMDGKKYRINDALQHIRNWKALKGHELSDREIEQLTHIYKSDKSTS